MPIAAEMTASELAAIIVAFAAVVGVVLLVFAITSLTKTLTSVRMSVEELRRESLTVIDELQRTVSQANVDLERLDALLDSATSVTNTVDSASQLAYLAFSNPLIKAIALASGTGRAVRAFRRRG
jgi:Sec-independent protein translocase protein TatA